MIKTLFFSFMVCLLSLLSSPLMAHGKLDADELQQRFSNTTQHCRKEKDQSTCTTYFSADGTIKRRLHADGKRREGSWKIDSEKDQLCITWKGKTKALCFDVYKNKDGTMDLHKKGKHKSTVMTFFPGNAEQL